MSFRRMAFAAVVAAAVGGCGSPSPQLPRSPAVQTSPQALKTPVWKKSIPHVGVTAHLPDFLGLHLEQRGNRVVVRSWSSRPAVLVRSTTDLSRKELNAVLYPTSILTEISSAHGYEDRCLADGITYFYQLRQGNRSSAVERVTLPPRALPVLKQPSLLVDKLHCVVEALDGGTVCKRYPLGLGRNPTERKLCFDNASTPEGFYRILGRQAEAQFYKAFDLDYPSALDRARYDAIAKQRSLPAIGGEIEIHGGGVETNWTFGCMAMRNADIDELFAHPEIGEGTPVTIVGSELTRSMVKARFQSQPWLRKAQDELSAAGFNPGICDGKLSLSTCEALGGFQQKRRLTVTMLPDAETLALLKARP